MHDGMPYGRNQGQGQGHSREVDRQSPMGLIFFYLCITPLTISLVLDKFTPISFISKLFLQTLSFLIN